MLLSSSSPLSAPTLFEPGQNRVSLQLLVGRLGRRRRAGGGGGDGRERDAVQVGDEGLPPSTECSVQRLATERRAKVNDVAPPGPVQSSPRVLKHSHRLPQSLKSHQNQNQKWKKGRQSQLGYGIAVCDWFKLVPGDVTLAI